ncbi:MAG: PEP-CTERM sorting domain-containing protein [Phycisphaerales bacterium]|nr:PEP-CTERM sorting domain-containing protein [Phycisphaerales bacterium]
MRHQLVVTSLTLVPEPSTLILLAGSALVACRPHKR